MLAKPGRSYRNKLSMGMAIVTSALLVGNTLPAHCSQSLPASLPELVEDADYVFRGTVVDVQSRLSDAVDPRMRVPYTFVTYHIQEEYKGTAQSDTYTLRFLGGEIDSSPSLLVEGNPNMKIGDVDTLFVNGNGEFVCPLSRCALGRYHEDGERIVDGRGRPISSGSAELELHGHEDALARGTNQPPDSTLSPETLPGLLVQLVSQIHTEEDLAALPVAQQPDAEAPFKDTFVTQRAAAPPPPGLRGDLNTIEEQVDRQPVVSAPQPVAPKTSESLPQNAAAMAELNPSDSATRSQNSSAAPSSPSESGSPERPARYSFAFVGILTAATSTVLLFGLRRRRLRRQTETY